MNKLFNGDCLEIMDQLISESIKVDAIITDPPYGTTNCKWDSMIPLDKMWERIENIVKKDSPIILFGTEPFSSLLRISNLKRYKYDWIWHKSKCGSAFTSKYRPQQKHENISVFGNGKINYYPQMRNGEPYYRKKHANNGERPNNHNLGVVSDSITYNDGFRYPETVIYFQQKWRRQDQIHPTQKPVELLEYLIRTYTKENEIILDFTMGSGTTGIACKNLNRDFIGIEIDENYFKIAKNRINER